MRQLLRRVRGAIGMGIVWAGAWSLVGFVPRWIFGLESDLPFPILFFGLGFIAGTSFSALLVLTEGRRRLDQQSLPRFAAYGAVGGLAIAALFVRGVTLSTDSMVSIFTLLTAACSGSAAATLALARRAVRRAASLNELPELHELPPVYGEAVSPSARSDARENTRAT